MFRSVPGVADVAGWRLQQLGAGHKSSQRRFSKHAHECMRVKGPEMPDLRESVSAVYESKTADEGIEYRVSQKSFALVSSLPIAIVP